MKDCPVEILAQRGNIKYLESLRELARENRNCQTTSEQLVWKKILRKKNTGFVFLRQKPISRFILDFYCSKLLLAIEMDGGIHKAKKHVDMERDEYLTSLGIFTLRIVNEDVLTDIEKVRNVIVKEIKMREINLPFSKGETAKPRGI